MATCLRWIVAGFEKRLGPLQPVTRSDKESDSGSIDTYVLYMRRGFFFGPCFWRVCHFWESTNDVFGSSHVWIAVWLPTANMVAITMDI